MAARQRLPFRRDAARKPDEESTWPRGSPCGDVLGYQDRTYLADLLLSKRRWSMGFWTRLVVAALFLGTTALSPPAQAGRAVPGILLGIGIGALIAGSTQPPPNRYGQPPAAYYPPPPG